MLSTGGVVGMWWCLRHVASFNRSGLVASLLWLAAALRRLVASLRWLVASLRRLVASLLWFIAALLWLGGGCGASLCCLVEMASCGLAVLELAVPAVLSACDAISLRWCLRHVASFGRSGLVASLLWFIAALLWHGGGCGASLCCLVEMASCGLAILVLAVPAERRTIVFGAALLWLGVGCGASLCSLHPLAFGSPAFAELAVAAE